MALYIDYGDVPAIVICQNVRFRASCYGCTADNLPPTYDDVTISGLNNVYDSAQMSVSFDHTDDDGNVYYNCAKTLTKADGTSETQNKVAPKNCLPFFVCRWSTIYAPTDEYPNGCLDMSIYTKYLDESGTMHDLMYGNSYFSASGRIPLSMAEYRTAVGYGEYTVPPGTLREAHTIEPQTTVHVIDNKTPVIVHNIYTYEEG